MELKRRMGIEQLEISGGRRKRGEREQREDKNREREKRNKRARNQKNMEPTCQTKKTEEGSGRHR